MTETYISIKKALSEYPSKTAFAKALGITKQAVNNWKHRKVDNTDAMPDSSAWKFHQVNAAAAKRCEIKNEVVA